MAEVTFRREPRVRTWGGWYEHTRVLVDGVELDGGIQDRRRNKRNETITFVGGYCVRGADVEWLRRNQPTREV